MEFINLNLVSALVIPFKYKCKDCSRFISDVNYRQQSISIPYLLHVATNVGVDVPTMELDKVNVVHNILDTELARNDKFSVDCTF